MSRETKRDGQLLAEVDEKHADMHFKLVTGMSLGR